MKKPIPPQPELQAAINASRALLEVIEERLESSSDIEKVKIRETLVHVVGTLMTHLHPPHTSKKPPRGLGYTFDEAQIVASLPEHGDSMSAAIRAHYPEHGPEWHEAVEKRIRRHKKAIDDFGLPDHT